MGCWNATCAISHLPIRAGEKVKAYLLVANEYGSEKMFNGAGICYSHDAYSPVSLPIHGEYNDYGALQNIKEDMNAKFLLEWVNKKFTKTYANIEEMISQVSQGEIELALIMIHSSIYDAAVEAVDAAADEQYDRHQIMFNVMEDFNMAHEYLQAEVARESLLEGLGTLGIKSADQDDDIVMMRSAFGRTYPKDEERGYNAIDAFTGRFSSSESQMESKFSRDYLEKLLVSDNAPIEDMVGHFMMCSFMSMARRTWITQAGNGSQCEEYRIHRLIAEATLNHIQVVKASYSEDHDLTDPADAEYFNRKY